MDKNEKKLKMSALERLKKMFRPSVEIEVEASKEEVTTEETEEKRRKREKDKAELKKLMGL